MSEAEMILKMGQKTPIILLILIGVGLMSGAILMTLMQLPLISRWQHTALPNSQIAKMAPGDFPDFATIKTKSGKAPQFILLSFDGSKSLEMWDATRTFAQELKKSGIPIHFTYYISGVYFLSPAHAGVYQPPGMRAGASQIGFADSNADIVERIQKVNSAIADGHEIASHVNGHFSGGGWSQKDWLQEFNEFKKLVFGWQENNGLDLATTLATGAPVKQNMPVLNLKSEDIVGFRAPLLARGNSLYPTLPLAGYKYDSSGVATSSASWPYKNAQGTWIMNMPEIPLAGSKSKIISMDYNFFSAQTQARDIIRRTNPVWQKDYAQMLTSYEQYFAANYEGNRAPVIIGHHFSTWNDGMYWQVMQDFAKEECSKPEVYCVSFGEAMKYLEAHPRMSASK